MLEGNDTNRITKRTNNNKRSTATDSDSRGPVRKQRLSHKAKWTKDITQPS